MGGSVDPALQSSSRAGRIVQQPRGYRAFLPASLPPNPPLRVDAALGRLLSDADHALGRLDGVASILPNPDLFVAMYVRHEAVLSIEGPFAAGPFFVLEVTKPRTTDMGQAWKALGLPPGTIDEADDQPRAPLAVDELAGVRIEGRPGIRRGGIACGRGGGGGEDGQGEPGDEEVAHGGMIRP